MVENSRTARSNIRRSTFFSVGVQGFNFLTLEINFVVIMQKISVILLNLEFYYSKIGALSMHELSRFATGCICLIMYSGAFASPFVPTAGHLTA